MDHGLLILAVLLASLGQILQKIGLLAPGGRGIAVLRPALLLGFAAVAAGAVLWLIVLSRMEVSRAYPFLSLGFVFVLLVSRLWLGERVPRVRWAGVALIVAGIVLIART